MRRLGATLVLVAGICSSCAALTVDFDTLAAGSALTDQSLADGVQFVGVFTVVNNTFSGAVTVPSPPNYVQAGTGTQVVRFVDPANPARLATTTSVAVTTPALGIGCYDAIELDAFDIHNHLVDSDLTPAYAAGGTQTTTTVSAAEIHAVKMTRLVGACIAPFDDLTFDALVVADTIFYDGFE